MNRFFIFPSPFLLRKNQSSSRKLLLWVFLLTFNYKCV